MARPILGAVGLTGLLLLAACGSSDNNGNFRVPGQDEYRDDSKRATVRGRLGPSDGILIFGNDRSGNSGNGSRGDGAAEGSGLGVNAYLWRATLDTLSFMPLSSADPFGGVVITDWYQPPSTTGERFRATAYILGRQLRSDGVRVAIFRQELRGGQWVDATVAQNTSSELEDRVLQRARELRGQSASR